MNSPISIVITFLVILTFEFAFTFGIAYFLKEE
jgi:hypothetical protein